MEQSFKPLQGKTAIITGGDSGIGRACAIELSERGANIVINYHSDEEGANETASQVKNNGSRALTYKADVGDYKQIVEMFATAKEQFGSPWILVNSAGLNESGIFVDDMEIEMFDRTLRTNLYGTFYTCREFIKARKADGNGGKIVNISSIHEEVARAGGADYCASKGAVRNLTRSLALELGPFGINVNNVAPGMVLTPMNQKALDDPEYLKNAEQNIPYRRAAEPWEVAKLVAYLVSDDASYAAGQTFTLDGGLSLNLGQGA
ncbi:short-chain dehydrogenase [Flavobacterium album]|uniref:Short-chain dehydrogenase n=1 Tax=Flavobacterium album TaxID=2175091 RepID=A0A2S1QWH4_9FLAO|nr:glucose 1-dehydrogenase [Flavobacterium album]AWH84734.1 short-chain dehydrogenase [Flavobacterium album]